MGAATYVHGGNTQIADDGATKTAFSTEVHDCRECMISTHLALHMRTSELRHVRYQITNLKSDSLGYVLAYALAFSLLTFSLT